MSWNVKDDLLRCLASLKENPPSEPFEEIVVDNMSTDGTVDAVKSRYPEVTLIENRQNAGIRYPRGVGYVTVNSGYEKR